MPPVELTNTAKSVSVEQHRNMLLQGSATAERLSLGCAWLHVAYVVKDHEII